MSKLIVALLLAVLAAAPVSAAAPAARSLDGSGNNTAHPAWGRAGTQYLRRAPAVYANGKSTLVAGPNARYISNRIFNDVGQNLFSENDISQWGWAWGQFLDHDLGLRNETPAESVPIPFAGASDPLEGFDNQLGSIDFHRTPAAPGTGTTAARQQINTISSYIDASNVYGTTSSRLAWLLAPDGASLLLPGGYLPRADARGDVSTAPVMDLFAAQVGDPADAVVAGDVRANENIALTAIQTLFAREHNRIVASLPIALAAKTKFDIARRIVGAEIQYITYSGFLPTLGIKLPTYRGYAATINASLGNEFATVGFRGHSMVHGEFEPTFPDGKFTTGELDAFERQGIEVEHAGGQVTLVIPLNVAFGNPDLLEAVGIDGLLSSLGEVEYKNDEQIDNTLRSVLFQVPKPGVDPASCGGDQVNPDCFNAVSDLGAIDVMRARDHGIPSYNALRRALGLPAKASFKAITGESTEGLGGLSINDPAILDFVKLYDAKGNLIDPADPAAVAVTGVRRTTLAARLRAVFGSLAKVDAFTGMMSERHVAGTEFGELQLAIWKNQFQALRDGDRFFYLNDPELAAIQGRYGLTYRHTLAEIVALDTGFAAKGNLFKAVP